MNWAIVKNWNDTVDFDDDVYVLGDLMLNDNDAAMAYIKQLKGHIHVIRGNHDTDTRMELYRDCYNIVEVCEAKYLKAEGMMFFLSHYPCLCSNHDEGKPLPKICISLCGHTHTKDKLVDMDKGMIYHVEVDAHNCTPVSLTQVIKDIEEVYLERKKVKEK